ncbi:MAG: hypothetical protein R3C13_14380 [Hyphomonas sp.]|uniref:hypothetical protein n=1 Tax=Hyphomonas sp. TaxID=87 RepID=UPI003526FDAA
MPRLPLTRLVLAALLPAWAALPALAGTPLEDARKASEDGPLYVFDVTFQDDTLDLKTKVDPSQPEGSRLTVVSPDESTLDKEAAKRVARLKEHTKGDVWCSNFASNIPDDAELISESQAEATYTFRPIPDEGDDDMAKAYKHLTGRVTVSKETPVITAFEMFNEKPFKPMPVAKVNTFRMKVACAYAPDGRTYIREMTLNIAGSAMMQKFSQNEHRQITGLTALPETASGQK